MGWCHPVWVQILALLLIGCTTLCLSFPICRVGMPALAVSRAVVKTPGTVAGMQQWLTVFIYCCITVPHTIELTPALDCPGRDNLQ